MESEDKLIEFSKTVLQNEIGIGQVLNEPNSLEKADFSSFLFENWNLLSYMLIDYLLLFFFSYIFLRKLFHLFSPLKKSKLILSKLLYGDYTQIRALSPEVAIIFLFFNLFLFILISLLTNFIKTDAVIVNTDEIIDSDEKLLSTSKIIFTQYHLLEYFNSFPKNSLLFKLFKRKREDNQYITREFNATEIVKIIFTGKSSSLFVFDTKMSVFFSLWGCAMYMKNPIIFKKHTNYHEIYFIYQMRKKLEKNKKKFINQWYVKKKF